MDEAAITRYISTNFEGVDVVVASRENGAPEVAWGDSFFIYDPKRDLEESRSFQLATFVTQDYGEFDNKTTLNRPGVFRLNIGVSKETFAKLFDPTQEHAFTALDRLMPHPEYGANHFVCVLNPRDSTFESVKPLLNEAYEIAVKRAAPRTQGSHPLRAGDQGRPHRDRQAARDPRHAYEPRQHLAAADILLDENNRSDHRHPRDVVQVD